MHIDQVLGRIGKLFFFVSTLFIVSISLAGIVYTDSFLRALGFDFSINDVNLYTFFTNVLVADQYHVMGHGVVLLIFVISFVYLFPRSLLVVYDLAYVYISWLIHIVNIPKKILFFCVAFISPFLIPFFLFSLIFYALHISFSSNKELLSKISNISRELLKDDNYKKNSERIDKNVFDFFKSLIIFTILSAFF